MDLVVPLEVVEGLEDSVILPLVEEEEEEEEGLVDLLAEVEDLVS